MNPNGMVNYDRTADSKNVRVMCDCVKSFVNSLELAVREPRVCRVFVPSQARQTWRGERRQGSHQFHVLDFLK